MDAQDPGPFIHAFLNTLSVFYGLAVKLRLFLYGSGVLKTKKLPCKVVSVGNITVGGSGKTPMTMHLAELFRKAGLRVVILSRGYKRAGRGFAVVSDGEKIHLGPSEAGDEPYLMATRLKGIPVIVGKDRVKSGAHAVKNFSPHVVVLDDGFQHIRLERDFNILLVDSKLALGNSFLLPRGILREPVSAAARANLVMVKGQGPETEKTVKTFLPGFDKPVKSFNYMPAGCIDIKDGEEKDAGYIRGKRVLALSGIAEPVSFTGTLEEAGAVVSKTLFYPDHHSYTPEDVDEIIKQANEGAVELVVTTDKDAVKLRAYAGRFSGITVVALSIEVKAEGLEALFGEKLGILPHAGCG
jgi:tetraacyldisaccharide 4'-kinase